MMKKLILSAVSLSVAAVGFAQMRQVNPTPVKTMTLPAVAQKTTGNGDTIVLSNITSLDTFAAYTWNSPDYGYVLGMNGYGDKGFAERYNFNASDSSLKVIGVYGLFTGNYSASTTKTIQAKAWSQGPIVTGTKLIYDGFPSATLAQSAAVSIKDLGINITGGQDSGVIISFATPTAYLTDTFFVGYDMSYNPTALAGDTISCYGTRDGNGNGKLPVLVGTDTLISVNNAVQWDDNSWNDQLWDNSGILQNFALFAIVEVKWNGML